MSNHSNTKHIQEAIPLWRDERFLRVITQVVSAVLILSFVSWIVVNFFKAADARGLNLSFNFLELPAGFPISDPAIEFSSTMSLSRAILVGVLNTLKVSVAGVIVATILGTIIALMYLSSNWLLSKLALIYVEFHRNIPLLVLLFIWYFTVFAQLPRVDEAMVLPGPIFLTIRGIYMTWPRMTDTGLIFMISLVLGAVLAITAYWILRQRRAVTGKETYYLPISLALLVGLPLIGWFLSGGEPLWLDTPEKSGFNFQGGLRLTPEFAGLFVGLTTYTAAFIAEVVRGGIQAVSKGQTEAARATGLNQIQVLSLVIMPQALRIIVPPMISQYLNLVKNSSLALAIGYQELFSVGKIAINQAGRAVPVFTIVMAIYLSISLITSFVLNIYNKRIQFASR